MSRKSPLLVISKILGLIVNTLPPDESILVIKGKIRDQFKCNYLKNERNLTSFSLHFRNPYQIFGNQDESDSLSVSETIDSKRRGYLNV